MASYFFINNAPHSQRRHRGAAGYGISLRAHGHARAHRGTRYAHGVRGVCPVPALAAAGTVEVLGALFHTEMFRVFYTTGPHSSVYECTKYSRIFVYEYEEYEVFFYECTKYLNFRLRVRGVRGISNFVRLPLKNKSRLQFSFTSAR
jgi:hypothetical protein